MIHSAIASLWRRIPVAVRAVIVGILIPRRAVSTARSGGTASPSRLRVDLVPVSTDCSDGTTSPSAESARATLFVNLEAVMSFSPVEAVASPAVVRFLPTFWGSKAMTKSPFDRGQVLQSYILARGLVAVTRRVMVGITS